MRTLVAIFVGGEGRRMGGAAKGLLVGPHGETLLGLGWDMRTDKELAFEVNLKTGGHRGGGYLL